MAQVLTDESNYENIADAIREKAGTSAKYTPSEMAGAIRSIPTNGAVTGVKGNAESEYRTGDVNITAANIGAKDLQTAVSSPSASGTAVAFIDTISQNEQGVITATKKTVLSATASQSGLMTATDKAKLDGIESGAQANIITGIKGDAEAAYRTGNVNLTPENLGAATEAEVTELRSAITAAEAQRMSMYPIVTVSGTSFTIDDAVEGLAPLSLSEGLTIYSRNMYRANLATRTSRGVTFTVDPDDPNTVTMDGTATDGAAYSYGTITTQTAMNLLEAGTYYLAYYDDINNGVRENRMWNPYINIIDYDTGESVSAEWLSNYGINIITLTAKSYVSIRAAVAVGKTVSNVTAHIYLSKSPPLPEYVPYKVPGADVMREHAVVEGNASRSITYRAHVHDDKPVKLHIATFNLGSYDYGNTTYPSVMEHFDDYPPFIGSLGADILCTQEDRVKYDAQTYIFDKLYARIYRYYGIPSYKSSSAFYVQGKGIYSDYPVSPCGAYTFVNSAVGPDGESEVWKSFSYRFLYINHKVILLISTHLAAHDNNTAARKLQVQEMLDFIAASRCDHVIMCGDFNVWEDELDPIKNMGFTLANCGIFGQFNTFSRGEHPFDNIIVSPNLQLRNVRMIENNLQDHYALTADVIVD